MQRPIKFRAWDEPGKLMVYSGIKDTHDLDGNDRQYWTYLVPGVRDGTWFELSVKDNGEVDREIYHGLLMQYTGLLDKSGKEIFEGDIVKVDNFSEEFVITKESDTNNLTVAEVLKDEEDVEINPDDGLFLSNLIDRSEVIGNIYENPELLKDA